MRLTPPRASGPAERAREISRNLPEVEAKWKKIYMVTLLTNNAPVRRVCELHALLAVVQNHK
jgi:hypothetical protein